MDDKPKISLKNTAININFKQKIKNGSDSGCESYSRSSEDEKCSDTTPISISNVPRLSQASHFSDNNSDGYFSHHLKEINEIPVPQSFNQLVQMIREEMKDYGLQDQDKINIQRLQKIMENFDSAMISQDKDNDWRKYQFFDDFRYTRNLVDDGNGKYNLIILCWGNGHVSPVHDHSGSHCILKVMGGQLKETRYEWPHGIQPPAKLEGNSVYCEEQDMFQPHSLTVTDEFVMKENQVAYMHDKLGLHRVSNALTDGTPAISLHLYSPPIEICRTFCAETGRARTGGRCVFYSMFGKKSNSCRAGLGDNSKC